MSKKKPVTAQDYIELGQFYILNQRYSEAIKQFKSALKLQPDAKVYFQLGLAYEASNQIPEAQEMYRKALQLDPQLKEASEHLERISS
ncbi:MAG: tetratricopeptide repeat protein [candidate division WOR-3 bacterium]|nr:tetratricopeptide repeat protein [candidate division WOR-3 bacterium]